MAKIVIIGGGVAGLSAGIHARKNGHQVMIFERQKTAGGNLTGWKRKGYTIDNCIHWLTGTNPHTEHYRIWQDLGAFDDKEVYYPNSLYTCEAQGQRLSLYADLERLEREMLVLSPADEKEILAFIKGVRAVQAYMGIGGKQHNQKASLPAMLTHFPCLLKYYGMSTQDLAKRFSHPLLQKFILCMLGRKFTSLAFLVAVATFCGKNGGIPQGGSLEMAKKIAKRFKSLGGELLLGKEAVKIYTLKNRAIEVEFSDGTRETADYFVCACDTKITFDRLLGRKPPHALRAQYANPNMPLFSAYHAAFACDIGDLDFRGDFMFSLPWQYQKLLKTPYLILREFSHEPTFAPEGKTVLQTLTFCNEKTAREWIDLRENKTAYRQKKRELSEALSTAISEKFPHMRGKLQCLDVWTPATYHRYTGGEAGAFMSFLLPKNKLPVPLSAAVPGLQNVLLATQWQQAPGGLPTAATLGKQAADLIEKKERARTFISSLLPSAKRKPRPV